MVWSRSLLFILKLERSLQPSYKSVKKPDGTIMAAVFMQWQSHYNHCTSWCLLRVKNWGHFKCEFKFDKQGSNKKCSSKIILKVFPCAIQQIGLVVYLKVGQNMPNLILMPVWEVSKSHRQVGSSFGLSGTIYVLLGVCSYLSGFAGAVHLCIYWGNMNASKLLAGQSGGLNSVRFCRAKRETPVCSPYCLIPRA